MENYQQFFMEFKSGFLARAMTSGIGCGAVRRSGLEAGKERRAAREAASLRAGGRPAD
jgi:hypothetical protein